nr:MAG TPA: hypothetical protein [Bacteriophage sp.]
MSLITMRTLSLLTLKWSVIVFIDSHSFIKFPSKSYW